MEVHLGLVPPLRRSLHCARYRLRVHENPDRRAETAFFRHVQAARGDQLHR